MKKLNEIIKNKKTIKVVSICGRFFSMDRDNRWDRIEKAYKAIIEGNADKKITLFMQLKKVTKIR